MKILRRPIVIIRGGLVSATGSMTSVPPTSPSSSSIVIASFWVTVAISLLYQGAPGHGWRLFDVSGSGLADITGARQDGTTLDGCTRRAPGSTLETEFLPTDLAAMCVVAAAAVHGPVARRSVTAAVLAAVAVAAAVPAGLGRVRGRGALARPVIRGLGSTSSARAAGSMTPRASIATTPWAMTIGPGPRRPSPTLLSC